MSDNTDDSTPHFPDLTRQEREDLLPAVREHCVTMLHHCPSLAARDASNHAAIVRRLCARVLAYARTGRTT